MDCFQYAAEKINRAVAVSRCRLCVTEWLIMGDIYIFQEAELERNFDINTGRAARVGVKLGR
jgi:hypothetical protein